jgi:thiol-disulfide isomerase/thioredoxin
VKLVARLVPVALAAAVACAGAGPPVPSSFATCVPTGLVSVGDSLPDCSFEGVGDHPPLHLRELKGTPTVLNFWASWCVACIAEMPDFQNVYQDLGRAVSVVGMNTLGVKAETRQEAERFAARTGVTYSLAYDQDGLLYSHFGEVGRPIMPLTVFADADGIVRHRNFGQVSEETLRGLIREHLSVG